MEEKKRIWDKILIGIVIGGAIGSVVGASLAPKKGKETREDIIKAATKAKFSVKSVFQKAKKILQAAPKALLINNRPAVRTDTNSRKHDKKNDL